MLILKVGGGLDIDRPALLQDVASLVRDGRRMVLVHGGSGETNEISRRLGKPPRFVTSVSGYSSRFSDEETMEMLTMACAGKVNTGMTSGLQSQGVNAVGLSGVDGGLARGERKDTLKVVEGGRRRVLRGDHSGRVEEINANLLAQLLDAGYTPVVSPPAISYSGEVINVDGDRMAAAIAGALGADVLTILTDRPGLLSDPAREDSLICRVAVSELERAGEFAQGRMRVKLLAAGEALQEGVPRVIISDGRRADPVRRALAGEGTIISGDCSQERGTSRASGGS